MGTQEKEKIVSEDDLLKSIQSLEKAAKKEEDVEDEEKVKTAELEKKSKEAIEEKASEDLKKSLAGSAEFSEVVGLLGAHVDTALEGLQKSVHASAERDLAMIRVLTDLRKSVDDLSAKVDAYGDQPVVKVDQAVVKNQILEKSAKTEQKVNPELLRKQISQGLERLAKSAGAGTPEADRYIKAAIKFESTGVLPSDDIVAEVRGLYKSA